MVFVTVLNRTTPTVSNEMRGNKNGDGQQFPPITVHTVTAAPTSRRSKEYKKTKQQKKILMRVAFVIVSVQSRSFLPMKTSAENQQVFGEDRFPFLFCQTQLRTITCMSTKRKILAALLT